jgi:hypothetical protein
MVQKRIPFFGKHLHFLFGMVQKRMPFLKQMKERERERESGFIDYAIIFKFKMGNERSILNKGMKRKRSGWKIIVAGN